MAVWRERQVMRDYTPRLAEMSPFPRAAKSVKPGMGRGTMRRNLVYLQRVREGRDARFARHCGMVYSGCAGGSTLANNGFHAMRMAQDKIRWLARLMLALVLFAQGIVAASACLTTEAGPAQAYAVAQDDKAAACHEEAIPNGHGTDTTLIDETQHARLPHPNPPPEPEKLLGGHPGEGANEALHEFHDNANACLSHCTQSDQISADQHGAPVAPPAGVIGWASTRPPATDTRLLAAVEQIAPDTGPPLPIRFCSFLN